MVSSSPAPLLDNHGLLLDKQNLDFNWINVTAIIEKIEGALEAVQAKIEQTAGQVEEAIEGMLQGIENAALEAAAKWNQTVFELAEKAQALGIDVHDCIEDQTPLAEVVEGLKDDARLCVASNLEPVKKALADLTAVGGEAMDLVARAKAQVVECTQKGNIMAVSACLAGSVPKLNVEAVGLVGQAALRAAIASAKAAALPPLTTLCTSKATAGRAAQASAIVDATAKCIECKLAQ